MKVFFIHFQFFMAAPAAYEISQARGVKLELQLQPMP